MLEQGLHLGYRRRATGGSWIARRRDDDGIYHEEKLGRADDLQEANGESILDFSQAQRVARAWWTNKERAGGDRHCQRAALQQMAARFAGAGALGALVRESQDLAATWREQDKKLIDALSKPEGQQNRAAIEALRREIAKTEGKLRAVAARLEQQFPDYAALASPKPLAAEEVQKLIGADEALVFFLTGEKESYVFAFTREGFEWKTIPLSADDLSKQVTVFRRGLDVDAVTKPVDAGGKPELFDLAVAHELYGALLGPVQGLIKSRKQLIVVPSGALTAVPFYLLVAEKPAVAVPEFKTLKDLARYRDAAWLLKRHAITVLPSVASLKALRAFAQKGQATKAMIGFGDPVFDPDELKTPAAKRAASGTAVKTRAYTDLSTARSSRRRCRGWKTPPTNSRPWPKNSACRPRTSTYARRRASRR